MSNEWNSRVGKGKTVNWPIGLGVETNKGIVNFVKKINGAISYTELNYAQNARLPMATIQNKAGNFIKPDLQSISIAAHVPFPADTRALIIDTAAPQGYPISGFSWLIFYKEQYYQFLYNLSDFIFSTAPFFTWFSVSQST